MELVEVSGVFVPAPTLTLCAPPTVSLSSTQDLHSIIPMRLFL